MKTKQITLLYGIVLASLLMGTAALNVAYAPWSWIWCWWAPPSYSLDSPLPDPWSAYIWGWWPSARDINPSTILLEGMYAPESQPKLLWWGFMLFVPFDGSDVLTALLLKGGHLSPGSNYIWLEITGQTYRGVSFQTSGRITLIIPEVPPP